jgi:hypothetical protein
LGKGVNYVKGLFITNITSYLQVYKRINPMKEYHIQLLTIKNARIQFIQSKLTTFNFYVCRISKTKALYHIIAYSIDHHQYVIIMKISRSTTT